MRIAALALALLALAPSGMSQVPCGLPGVTVTVSPDNAAVGQPILVTLTNNSNQLIQLPSSCTFNAIHAGTVCDNASVVFAPFCLSVITPIQPGQSHSMPWDQLDGSANQVPAGDYSVSIRYWDAAFTSLTSCCASFKITDDPGTPFCVGVAGAAVCPCGNFGSGGEGCANSTGNGALLTASGDPVVGADTLVFTLVQAPANKPALIFSGPATMPALPLADGLLCIGGSIDRIGVVFTNGAGSAQSPWTISVEEGLIGGELRHYQTWYRDQAGPCSSGANTSNGLSIQWL